MDYAENIREDGANLPVFDEYLRVSEPHTRERAQAWKTAIGLQAVDGLQVSEYLKETAQRHIEGEISIDEAQNRVRSYYRTRTARLPDDAERQEADTVSVNIAKLLGEQSFSFSVPGFISTHRRIFEGVFDHAGTLRGFDITKKEWVLRGDTVLYVAFEDLERTLEYDLEQERRFSYAGLSMNDVVSRLAKFVAGLWQVHPFCEGNTRTTAIFTVKYLRLLGFQADNTLFERHSWYFRNALVRANYRNVKKGIAPNFDFLIRFFRNLLMGELNELRNRYMLIDAPAEWGSPIIDSSATSPASSASGTPASCPSTSSSTTPASSVSVPENLGDPVLRLVAALGEKQMSVKESMAAIGLKDRKNFVRYSLNPALALGIVAPLYPEIPNHPRQKYFLTERGLACFSDAIKNRTKTQNSF